MHLPMLFILLTLTIVSPRVIIDDIPVSITVDSKGTDSELSADKNGHEFVTKNKREISITKNDDGSFDVNGLANVVNNEKRKFTAKAGVDSYKKDGTYHSAEVGLSLSSANGHSSSFSAQRTPKVGDRLSAQGTINLLDTVAHKLDTSAFWNKNFPANSDPSSSNYGASFGYLNRNGHAVSLAAQHDSISGDTLSAAGKLNILLTDTSNLVGKATWTKSLPINQNLPSSESFAANLDYLNKRGDSVSLAAQRIENFRDRISAAGKVNVLHTDNHKLDASADWSRNFPSSPGLPYNTYGGNLNYRYKDILGSSLNVHHNDMFHKTDYSVLGNLNLYKDRSSSLDFSTGLTKSVSQFSSSPWSPNANIIYSKSW